MKKAFETVLINIANLFKVKSIITLMIISTISILVMKNVEIPSEYAAFAGSIVTYFFTKNKDTEK
ncbi:MAG TPA: hypothetical protein GX708_16150 [Gallicola sp.]|nr:hypothetical protein [Gallicola sp.]